MVLLEVETHSLIHISFLPYVLDQVLRWVWSPAQRPGCKGNSKQSSLLQLLYEGFHFCTLGLEQALVSLPYATCIWTCEEKYSFKNNRISWTQSLSWNSIKLYLNSSSRKGERKRLSAMYVCGPQWTSLCCPFSVTCSSYTAKKNYLWYVLCSSGSC